MTKDERKTKNREKRQAKRKASSLPTRKQGSLKSEMTHRIRQRAKKERHQLTHTYRDRAIYACAQFDEWRKQAGWTNRQVRSRPRDAVVEWAKFLQRPISTQEKLVFSLRRKQDAYQPSSIHTMVAYVCMGLGIEMRGIASSGTALDKIKSQGRSNRSINQYEKERNKDMIRFAEMVGGRRSAYSRLTGADLVVDESGEYCVRFLRDKGGKTQFQRIPPEYLTEVHKFFKDKGADEKIFPEIDKNLDLHGIRAEHARKEYERYARICSTQKGRAELRRQLWRRFTDPMIGNKAWLTAKKQGNFQKMKAKEHEFIGEMADGIYRLRESNREAAILHDRPVEYDRLALCCVSVFALSHWRNEVTVKHYLI